MSALADEPDAVLERDSLGAEVALLAPEPLAAFNRAAVLSAADIQVAVALCALAGVADPPVLLASALAVRAPRLGHVLVDLETISQTVTVENEEPQIAALPWPQPADWVASVAAATTLVGGGEGDLPGPRPLRLLGSRLYLDRYWRQERALAAALTTRAGLPPAQDTDLDAAVIRLFGDGEPEQVQREAARSAIVRGLTVIAGGPGTGKTTTIARITALMAELAARRHEPPPLIALCAFTGKAAARMQEAVHDEVDRLPIAAGLREQLLELQASTIHRLLGAGSRGFRHDAGNRLPHDVVIVDESSMVSLSLMARLLEAVRSDARVVLVGDPDQLSAIEAGAVLRDIVGPAADGPTPGRRFGESVVVLERGYRYGREIAALADAVRAGDADAALAALDAGGESITWLRDPEALEPLRERAVAALGEVLKAARAGDAITALDALGSFRLLCAHRRGPHGVASWAARVERWLADAVEGFVPGSRDYAGRPLLITQNNRELGLFNGDTGVVIDTPDGEGRAVFARESGLVEFAPSRLEAAETLYATTVHKAQGSQFAVAALVLPDPDSRVLSRELLYTAVTRARERLIIVGGEDAIRIAIARPGARASGLRERLWDSPA